MDGQRATTASKGHALVPRLRDPEDRQCPEPRCPRHTPNVGSAAEHEPTEPNPRRENKEIN